MHTSTREYTGILIDKYHMIKKFGNLRYMYMYKKVQLFVRKGFFKKIIYL